MLPSLAQRTYVETLELADIGRWCNGWLSAKRAEGLSPRTLEFYRDKSAVFLAYCAAHNVKTLDAIDAGLLREWLLDLEAHGHNPGGVMGHYRAVKCFLRWYETELDDPAFRNPIRKVKPPKVPEALLDPVDLADVQAMIETCQSDRRGVRDRAILRVLLDTGARGGAVRAGSSRLRPHNRRVVHPMRQRRQGPTRLLRPER